MRLLTLYASCGSPSPDPLAGRLPSPQSLNRYAYVLNDPVNLIDPLGLDDDPPQCGWVCTTDNKGVKHCKWECAVTVTDTPLGPNPYDASRGSGPDIFDNFGAWLRWRGFFALLLDVGAGVGGGVDELKKVAKTAFCLTTIPQRIASQVFNSTLAGGVGGSAGVGVGVGASVTGGVSMATDPQGNVGLVITAGGNPGAGVLGVGATGGVQVTASNASHLNDLKGRAYGAGASTGPMALDFAVGSSASSLTATGGVGKGQKTAAGQITYTWVPVQVACGRPVP